MKLFRQNKPSITRDDALAAKPRRLVDARMQPDERGGGSLQVPLSPTRWGKWFFRVPEGTSKTFEFDAIGVFVWQHCDGKTSVQQIIRRLAKQYQLNLRAAEVATIQFLHTLAKKGLIGMKMRKN